MQIASVKNKSAFLHSLINSFLLSGVDDSELVLLFEFQLLCCAALHRDIGNDRCSEPNVPKPRT